MTTVATKSFDSARIRADFPLLAKTNRGKPIIYLDSAASAQKPKQVIEAISHFYSNDYANIHRGIYELSERATVLYEGVRETVRHFINAPSAKEIIYTRGTTEAINLVAQSLGRHRWQAGDEIIVSEMEHHSNIVPWYLLAQQVGIKLKVIPVKDDGTLDMEAYERLFTNNTKMVAVSHVSNVLGTINPIEEITAIAKQHHVLVTVDGAQAVPHLPVDVQRLGCDFYTFSGHKLYGPTGIGILWGREDLLDAMPPYQGGGDMIESVFFDKITYAPVPHKFEAGTPDIAGVIGLGAAIHYLSSIGMQAVYEHEQALLAYALTRLQTIDGMTLIGTAREKVGVIAFVMDCAHAHDIGTVLDHAGIAIRAGHHCAEPLMKRFNITSAARASFGIYNQECEVDALIQGLQQVKGLFDV